MRISKLIKHSSTKPRGIKANSPASRHSCRACWPLQLSNQRVNTQYKVRAMEDISNKVKYYRLVVNKCIQSMQEYYAQIDETHRPNDCLSVAQ